MSVVPKQCFYSHELDGWIMAFDAEIVSVSSHLPEKNKVN